MTKENKTLQVLGCLPMALNILLEIANEANDFNTFNIYKNVSVDEIQEAFEPQKNWNVTLFEPMEKYETFTKNDVFAISVVGVKSKESVYHWFKEKTNIDNSQLINLIHPKAFVSKSAKLNYGLQVEPQSTIAACASIGFGVNIKRNSSIGHHSEIGDFATINPGATISSYVKIGKKTMIGSGVSVKNNIKIGENCIIGVGSVVVKDIPSNTIAYGNPCKVYKQNT